jgi:hypothetical protein
MYVALCHEIHCFSNWTDNLFSVLQLTVFFCNSKGKGALDIDGCVSQIDTTQVFASLSLSVLDLPLRDVMTLHCSVIVRLVVLAYSTL